MRYFVRLPKTLGDDPMEIRECVEVLKTKIAVVENELKNIRKMEWIIITAVIGQLVLQINI